MALRSMQWSFGTSLTQSWLPWRSNPNRGGLEHDGEAERWVGAQRRADRWVGARRRGWTVVWTHGGGGSLVEWTRVDGGSPVEWTHDGGCSRFGLFGQIVFDLGDWGCGRWVADG